MSENGGIHLRGPNVKPAPPIRYAAPAALPFSTACAGFAVLIAYIRSRWLEDFQRVGLRTSIVQGFGRPVDYLSVSRGRGSGRRSRVTASGPAAIRTNPPFIPNSQLIALASNLLVVMCDLRPDLITIAVQSGASALVSVNLTTTDGTGTVHAWQVGVGLALVFSLRGGAAGGQTGAPPHETSASRAKHLKGDMLASWRLTSPDPSIVARRQVQRAVKMPQPCKNCAWSHLSPSPRLVPTCPPPLTAPHPSRLPQRHDRPLALKSCGAAW